MRRVIAASICAGLTAVVLPHAMQADGGFPWNHRPGHRPSLVRERSFVRVGTLANYRNNVNPGDETVSEIVAATADGRLLVYTDSPLGEVGFIDITNPSQPLPAGKLALGKGYEPTSVDVLGTQYALVAADTSESFTNPSGSLLVVDLATRTVVRELALGGQPDSVRISPDQRFAAVAIENQRDEDLCVGGTDTGLPIVDDEAYEPGTNTTEDLCEDGLGVPGGLPQLPAGYLAVIRLTGANPASWTRHDVALTGLARYAPEDPEPEFVDINARNEAVVTLQENNHVVIVDLDRLAVTGHFPAGDVTLTGVDATEDGIIALTETLPSVPREPDAVTWLPGFLGRSHIGTANEGDLFGGSRGFSIFQRSGGVVFDSGAAIERLAVQHGHYPEDRSENKGTEPESIEYARYGREDYVFVGSERGGFVAAYTLDRFGRPRFEQVLPAPLEPEGLLAIPHRNLLVVSGEADSPEFGVRSTLMIYELKPGTSAYPQILSEDHGSGPIAWSALSGMTAVPGQPDSLLAVWDSYYAESRIFRIDVSDRPAMITEAVTLRGGRGNYDPEGIAIGPDRSIWIASEGNASDSRPNLLVQVDQAGHVLQEVGLPAEILACRKASTKRGTLGSGFEGVAILPGRGDGYRLLVAQQRGWDFTTPGCEDLDDDGGGLNASGEPNWSRIWIYDPLARVWDHVAWELAPKPKNASWVGLSEISETPTGEYVLIERDNRTGDFGELKTLVKVAPDAAHDGLISQAEKAAYNLRPRLTASRGWITDKPEGLAIAGDGRLYVVTDNDGVEDWSGETWFLDLGRFWRLFR
jgi:hypothetical protein